MGAWNRGSDCAGPPSDCFLGCRSGPLFLSPLEEFFVSPRGGFLATCLVGFLIFCLSVFAEADAEPERDGEEDSQSATGGGADEDEYVPFSDAEMSGSSDGNVVPTIVCFCLLCFLPPFRAMYANVMILVTP